MERTVHIRTFKKVYYGAIILCILFTLDQSVINNQPLSKTVSGPPGIIAILVLLYSIYKIFFGKGKIILSASEFKLQGYNWTHWSDLGAVYPHVEHDLENGERNYIKFRLKDGTDLSIRSEYLEMDFEQISEIINKFRTNYISSKE